MVDVDDRLGECAWRFFGKVVTSVTLDEPVFIPAREFTCMGGIRACSPVEPSYDRLLDMEGIHERDGIDRERSVVGWGPEGTGSKTSTQREYAVESPRT